MPKLAIPHWPEVSNPSGSVVSTMFCKANSAIKQTFFLHGDFRQFSNKNVQIWEHFFPILFPKDSESLKILDIWLREVGAKRRLSGTSKVNTQTDILTYRKHWPRGPMLWKEDRAGQDRTGQKRVLARGQSFPQELIVDLHSLPYVMVPLKSAYLVLYFEGMTAKIFWEIVLLLMSACNGFEVQKRFEILFS